MEPSSSPFEWWLARNRHPGWREFDSETARSLRAVFCYVMYALAMISILVVSNNAHKVEEIAAILGEVAEVRPLSTLTGAPVPVEDGLTFADNATIKAETIQSWLRADPARRAEWEGENLFLLADDSGLEVDALEGAPGVHSARFAADETGAEGNSPDSRNNAKLLRLMADVMDADRGARFRCVLALAKLGGGEVCLFDGTCEGRILRQTSGNGGFGYDPLFVPAGCDCSFAELGDAVKNSMSHRSNALAGLKKHLSKLRTG